MKAFIHTIIGSHRRLFYLLGALCLLFLLAGTAAVDNPYFEPDAETIQLSQAEDFNIQNPTKGVFGGKITKRSLKHKRHFFLHSRNLSSHHFLKNTPDYHLAHAFWSFIPIHQSLFRSYGTFLRPSYYVLLFLYALF